MNNIQLMKPELANLIAAGEVIERPSSVIKELVENSIDAGAKNIYIGVSDAGRGKIIVRDDGSGMSREDARLCFLRHASSKIKTEFDLTRIHTLGFRGEAIPSIAAVSKVVLTTSTGEGAGTRVISSPNEDLIIEDAPSRKGTIFEITSLFFNTPARLKYLKSPQSENFNIIDTCEHLALGFPDVCFSLAIDGRAIFSTSGRGDLLETIQKIYGNKIAQSLYPIKKESFSYSFNGFISKPEISYSRRKNMLTFLNHRVIYDFKLNKAIEDAYKDYLPPLRYPFCIINLEIDPSLVDVNVHPTKKEVRISLEDDILRDLKDQVSKTLAIKRPIYDMNNDPKAENLLTHKFEDLLDTFDNTPEEIKESKSTSYPEINTRIEKPRYFQDSLPLPPTYESTSRVAETFVKKPETEFTGEDYYGDIFRKEEISYKLPEMHPIGQVLQTYILCDSDDGFYIIDQHAAAERINFEKTQMLFATIKSRAIPLFPLTIDLSFKEVENYDEKHIQKLESIGIVTERFGDRTIKATEIPAFLNEENLESVIQDCVHSCLNDEEADPLALLHLTIANIACKKSIKANHIMSIGEIEALLRDLSKCKNPANCPHGRPTMIKVSRTDIEKLFRRSGF